MKKILLISNYFFPCTLTPSQRITFWARNMYQLGYYPTVLTREWNSETRSHQDTKRPLGETIRHEVFDTHEVFYLPFHPGILDRAYLQFGESTLRPLFLFVKLLDVFMARFTLRFTSFANFLPFIKKHFRSEEFPIAIISGEPFYLFKIGDHLKKNMNINWIADYRDDWSTNELQMQKSGGLVRKWIAKVEAKYEKTWVGTSQSIVSVSEVYTQRISDFVQRPSITIQNGFEEELLELEDLPLFEKFTIAYSGVLYPSQDIRIVIEALELAVQHDHTCRLVFLGAGFDVKEKQRIESLIPAHLKDHVEVTDRMPRTQAIRYLQQCHVLLGMAYGKMKGIPSSKLYEYLALGKPVLLCPSDHDVMESILNETQLGFFAQNSSEAAAQIDRIRLLHTTPSLLKQYKTESRLAITKYSRFHQLENFLTILH
jgi:glycosyltransferase involved in cell wall biosynthesis